MKKPQKKQKSTPPQPNGWTLSTQQAVDCGYSERYLRSLAAEGVLPQPHRGRWPGREFMVGLMVHCRSLARSGSGELAAARLRREVAKARCQEVEASEREHKVVDVEDTIRLWVRCTQAVRTRILALPAKAAALLEGKSVTERESVLRREVDDALAELTRLFGKARR